MIDIISLLTSKPGRIIILPQFNQFVNNSRKMLNQYIKNTYSTSVPISSKGLNILSTFLTYVNLDDFLAITNLTDQLFYIKQYIIDNIFTTIITNPNKTIVTSNAFVKTPVFSPVEILIPVPQGNSIDFYNEYINSQMENIQIDNFDKNKPISEIAPLTILTIDKKLLPFRLIYADTNELSMNIKQGQLLYTIDIPSTIGFILHIEKLFMGLAYYDKVYGKIEEDVSITKYLYQWCILPLLIDTFDIWLIGIIDTILDSIRNDSNDIESLKNQVYNGDFVGKSTFRYIFQGTNVRWIDDVISLGKMLSNGNIRISDFLKSIILPSGYSILQYFEYIIVDNELPVLIQVQWLEFFKSYKLLKLLMQLLDLSKEPSKVDLLKSCYKIIRQYRSNHIWTYCPDRVLKQLIKTEINSIYQWLKTKLQVT